MIFKSHRGQWIININSGDGLLPDGTKPSPEPILAYHQWGPLTFSCGEKKLLWAVSQKLLWIWQPHIPVDNELNLVSNTLSADGMDPWCCWIMNKHDKWVGGTTKFLYRWRQQWWDPHGVRLLSLGLFVQHVYCIVLNYHWLDIRDDILLGGRVNCSPSLKNAHLCNVWWDNSPNILSPSEGKSTRTHQYIIHPNNQSKQAWDWLDINLEWSCLEVELMCNRFISWCKALTLLVHFELFEKILIIFHHYAKLERKLKRICLKNYTLDIIAASPRGQWVDILLYIL